MTSTPSATTGPGGAQSTVPRGTRGSVRRIVVTGAVGHIGSHFVRDVADVFPGVDVLMIDNLMTQRFASLFDLPRRAAYRFIEADVRSTALEPLLDGADAVIHLAAITDATASVGRAAEVEANNLEATSRVAHACLQVGAPLIALSSTSVYGTQQQVVSEDCSPAELQPQSPYATTKLKEEALVAELARGRGLRAAIFRFGTIFGWSPGMRFHTAVNKFCWQAVMGTPITVWRTAFDQKRPYLDLRDASRALCHAISRQLFDGRIYNVLTLNATVRGIVDAIRAEVPDLRVEFVDSPIMNQLSYEVSCQRFLDTGFRFSGSLPIGVAETIARLRQANSVAPSAVGTTG